MISLFGITDSDLVVNVKQAAPQHPCLVFKNQRHGSSLYAKDVCFIFQSVGTFHPLAKNASDTGNTPRKSFIDTIVAPSGCSGVQRVPKAGHCVV